MVKEPDELQKRLAASLRDEFQEVPKMSAEECLKLIHDLRTHQIELEMANEDLRWSQKTLFEFQKKYFDLYELAPTGYVTLSANGVIDEVNLTITEMLNKEKYHMMMRPFSDLVVHEDQDIYYNLRKDLIDKKKDQSCECRLKTGDGKTFWAFLSGKPVLDDEGAVAHCLLSISNISKKKQMEEKLQFSGHVIDNMIEGVMMTDKEGIIYYVNPAFTDITGYSLEEAIGEKPTILKSYRHDKYFYEKMWGSLNETGRWHGEIWDKRKNGEIYPERLTISAIKDAEGNTVQYAAVFYDMSLVKKKELEIKYKAYHDALTGVPNRLLFYDRLKQMMTRAKRNKGKFALLYIDLDNFKYINDSMGHSIGDILLQRVASRLEHFGREGDTVARLGGDEFIILLDEVHAASEVAIFAKRVVKVLAKPFLHQEREITTSVSLGIAMYPEHGETSETLLMNADTAMYHAKYLGKNNHHFFTKSLDEKGRKRKQLENDLRAAMVRKELHAYYQPIYCLGSGRVKGMEALARWPQADGNVMLPSEFIPIAEGLGFVSELDQLVIQKACGFVQRLNRCDAGSLVGSIHVSVNLSGIDFCNVNLCEELLETLAEFGLTPSNVGIEITESAVIQNVGLAIQTLHQLREAGFNVSIDDFGIGYSSLSYMAKLPINILKIDQSFLVNLPSDKKNRAIAKAMVSMAHDMDIHVIAEGVENEAQLDFLQSIACDQVQGNFLSPPLPEHKMEDLLTVEQ